jgi:hypothetical protein
MSWRTQPFKRARSDKWDQWYKGGKGYKGDDEYKGDKGDDEYKGGKGDKGYEGDKEDKGYKGEWCKEDRSSEEETVNKKWINEDSEEDTVPKGKGYMGKSIQADKGSTFFFIINKCQNPVRSFGVNCWARSFS